jgi:hypothetical protein
MSKSIILTMTLFLLGCKSHDVNSLNEAEQKALEKLMIIACQRGLGVEGGYVPINGSFFTTETDSLPESGRRLSRSIHSLVVVIPRFTYISTKEQVRDRLRAEFDSLGVQVEDSSFFAKTFYGKRSLFLVDFEIDYTPSPSDTTVLVLTVVPAELKSS